MSHAQWGVDIRSLKTGESLYQLNAGKLMMPASNVKVVTLAGTAHVIGWDWRFTTTLETFGRLDGTTLHGDLIVRGGGDPTINTRNGRAAAVFAEWIAALKAGGIQTVDGRIIGDDQLFDDEGLGAGWAWDDLQYAYAAPVGALQYNEGAAELTVLPGPKVGDPAVISLPVGTGLTLVNRATTGPFESPESIDLRRHPDRPVLEVTGVLPLQPPAAATPARTVVRQVAVVNPTLFFVESLKSALLAAGIHVTGAAVDLDDVVPDQSAVTEHRILARSESAPMREVAAVLMKDSQNLYAETFLKSVGVASSGSGTTRAGREGMLAALGDLGIDHPALVMADGSGLSRYNYATAELLANILQRMYSDPRHREPFLAAMPIAGRDGTVAKRLLRTRAEGNAAAKTGSISNVRALSGYVRSRDGEPLVFSILANDFIIPASTVNWIVDLAVEILANFTRSSEK
jgi:serine-type D-Ala-D-Ala carboxypeptidase/endopeptidase (penicillin-binding protein 4)